VLDLRARPLSGHSAALSALGKHAAAVAWTPVSEREAGEGEFDALDDEFAHLFRDDAPAPPEPAQPSGRMPAPAAIDEGWDPLIPIPTAGAVDPPLPPPAPPAQADDLLDPIGEIEPEVVAEEDVVVEEVEEVAEAEPVEPADPAVGRLFRSRGAPETVAAITAVGSLQARRLRTMGRSNEPAAPAEPAEQGKPLDDFPSAAPAPAPAPLPVAASGEPAPALEVMANPPARPESAHPRSSRPPRRDRAGRDRAGRRDVERGGGDERASIGSGTLTGLGVYAVTIGVTVILAFGETLFFGGEPGVITGIGLLVVSVFAAFAVRTRDAVNAIFAPSIAFFIAAITAGQFDLNANDLSGRAVALFFLLGASWVWIIGSTVAALVIVALRRRLG